MNLKNLADFPWVDLGCGTDSTTPMIKMVETKFLHEYVPDWENHLDLSHYYCDILLPTFQTYREHYFTQQMEEDFAIPF